MTIDSSCEFAAGGDISPLIASSHLHRDIVVLIEIEEIVTLEDLVAKFGVADSLFRVQPGPHAVLG